MERRAGRRVCSEPSPRWGVRWPFRSTANRYPRGQAGVRRTWLQEAKTLHTVQMKEPADADKMRKLMDSVEAAYDCATVQPSHSRIAPGAGSFGQYGVLPQR